MMFGGDPFGIHVQSICNESRSVNATKGQEFQFRTSSFALPHGWNNRISEPPHPYADFPLAIDGKTPTVRLVSLRLGVGDRPILIPPLAAYFVMFYVSTWIYRGFKSGTHN